jgi:hypothetical protein
MSTALPVCCTIDIFEIFFFPTKPSVRGVYCKPYIYWQCQLIIPGVHCHRN